MEDDLMDALTYMGGFTSLNRTFGEMGRSFDEMVRHMSRGDRVAERSFARQAVNGNATKPDPNWIMTRLLREEAETKLDLANKGDIVQALRSPGQSIINLLQNRAADLAREKHELQQLEELDLSFFDENPMEGIF